MKSRVTRVLRRPLLVVAGAACSLGLATAAFAQDDIQQQQQQQQPMQQQQSGGQQQQLGSQMGGQGLSGGGGIQRSQTFVVGTIKGVVQNLNFSKGLLTIDTGGRNVTLRARPMEIVQLNPGDVVALRYHNFNGQLWISMESGQGGEQTAEFAQYGTYSGSVTRVDKAQGTITVRGRTFLVHPAQLQTVLPGQFVALTFANVGGGNWAMQIDPVTGGSLGGTGGGGGQLP